LGLTANNGRFNISLAAAAAAVRAAAARAFPAA
jgi:hypothetical protein